MKIIKTLLLLFLLTIFTLPFSPSTHACSCVQPGAPTEELAKSDAVFAGEVLSVKGNLNNVKQIKVKVKQSWKGVDTKKVTVYTAQDSAGCGFNFDSGQEYLIYAHSEDGKYTSNLCTRTAELASAQQDLQELGADSIPLHSNDESEKNTPTTTQNLVIGSLSLALVLGGCFFYRWKATKE